MEEFTFVEMFLFIIATIVAIIVAYYIFTIPIRIAKNKNLSKNEFSTVCVLNWLGLFAGITWVIALCLAIAYKERDEKL